MKKFAWVLALVTIFNLFQAVSASADCESEYKNLLSAKLKGVSDQQAEAAYQNCLLFGKKQSSGSKSQLSEEEQLERAIVEALTKGDVATASSLVAQLQKLNAAKAASYLSQITSSTSQGCTYNGKYYASCDEANRQYQIDLDNYKKQLAASGSQSTSGSQSGSASTSGSQSGSQSTSGSQSGSQSTSESQSGSASTSIGSQDSSCPADGSGSPDPANVHLIADSLGKISAKLEATKSSGTKRPTEFLVHIRKISFADKEAALKGNQYELTNEVFNRSPIIYKGSLDPNKEHIFELSGEVYGIFQSKNRCGSVYSFLDSGLTDIYDWSAKKWSWYVSATGPKHYVVDNWEGCPASNREYKDLKATLDFDENGPLLKIAFTSKPPMGTTLSVSLGYRDSSNNVSKFSKHLLMNVEAVDQNVRIPREGNFTHFDTITYLHGPCGYLEYGKVAGDEYKVLTNVSGVGSTLTLTQLQRECQRNRSDAQTTLLGLESLIASFQASVLQFPIYTKYVSWFNQFKIDNKSTLGTLESDCPERIKIQEFSEGLKRVQESIKVDLKTETEKIKRESLEASALAKAEAEAKAKAEEETKAMLEAAKKKATITCVKGKISKKVTAANPKCPTGYKKK